MTLDTSTSDYIRARTREHRVTQGLPRVEGTQLAADLAPHIERLREMEASGRTVRDEIGALRIQRRATETHNIKTLAADIRAGKDVADPPSLREIEDTIASKTMRAEAIGKARAGELKAVERLVARNDGSYEAELRGRTSQSQLAVEEALVALDVAVNAHIDVAAAIDWLRAGGRGEVARPIPSIKLMRDPNFASVLGAIREWAQPRPEPRAKDASEPTGWALYGELVSGKRAIGDAQKRPANDAQRAKQAQPMGPRP